MLLVMEEEELLAIGQLCCNDINCDTVRQCSGPVCEILDILLQPGLICNLHFRLALTLFGIRWTS